MSRQAVEQVIGKMVIDAGFRKAVKADPKKALTGYALDPGEIEGFSHLDVNDFDKTVTGLDQRVSKGLMMN